MKQVIIVRRLYPDQEGKLKKIRTGKLMAQACHASLGVFLNYIISIFPSNKSNIDNLLLEIPTNVVEKWINGKFTKICVGVDTEEELLEIYDKAKKAKLPCYIVKDAGMTEFKEPTYTVVAVGPAESNKIDKLTKHLPLI